MRGIWGGFVCALAVLALTAGAALAAPAGARGVQQMLAGNVSVPAGTTEQDDLQLLAGTVDVQGTLDGSVTIGAGQVTVGPAGVVQGSVVVHVGQLTVQPGGQVTGAVTVGGSTAGSLTCPSQGSACVLYSAPAGAQATATTTQALGPGGALTTLRAHGWQLLQARWWRWLRVSFHLLGWLGMLAVALPVAALWPGALAKVSDQIQGDPGRTVLVGLGVVILALPALLLVTITIIGIPVAFAAGLGLVGAWFFGYIGVVSVIGQRTLRLAGVQLPGLLWAIVLGSALVAVAEWVPVVGGLIWLAVACFGLGAVVLTRFGTRGGGSAQLPPAQDAAPDPAP